MKILNAISFKILFVLSLATLVLMLGGYEPGGESWGYWFFAKEFIESGDFIISGRSPLYTLYLQLFYWIGYPISFHVEWFVSSLIVGYALYMLLQLKVDKIYALIATILWLPLLRYSEPTPQSLALAMSCFAFTIRVSLSGLHSKRFIFSISYVLLIMAYMFRPTYIVQLILIIGYDVWGYFKSHKFNNILLILKFKKHDIPLAIIMMLLVVFTIYLSPHQWNNAWFATVTWFPVSGEHPSLRDGGFIGSMNWSYIKETYGSFENKDFYFTNKELFGNAGTMWDAISNNFNFVLSQIYRNTIYLFELISGMSIFTNIFRFFVPGIGSLLGVIFLAYGAIMFIKEEKQLSLFFITSTVLIGMLVIVVPKLRYLLSLTPFLVFSSFWYSLKIKERVLPMVFSSKKYFIKSLLLSLIVTIVLVLIMFLRGRVDIVGWQAIMVGIDAYSQSFYWVIPAIEVLLFIILLSLLSQTKLVNNPDIFRLKIKKIVSALILPILLVSFQPVYGIWGKVVDNIVTDPQLMRNKNAFSIIESYSEINKLSKECVGIMTLEHTIFPIFLESNNVSVYDIWEIPPFGSLGNSTYGGLSPDRIDCLFISDSLMNTESPGMATNKYIRYDNYIKSYVEILKKMGAKSHYIHKYGVGVIL